MYLKTRTFSHVYVEREVAEHPRTLRILARLPGSRIVMVDDYKNVFGRGRQDFWRQKSSPKLILALKKENLVYGGNGFLQSSVSPNFAYNTPVLNCPYDCHYCYLQGMFPGANLVSFVNTEDLFAAAEDHCARRPDPSSPMPLAISYDSDLLALEGLLGHVREWIDWSRRQPDVLVEVRTKSAQSRLFKEMEPSSSVRFAWTLSPDEICRRYEAGAPGLESRLKSLETAARHGWRIAICLDPVLKVPGGEDLYSRFLDLLRDRLPWERVERVEIGVFRVSTAYFKRMQKRPGTDLLHYPYDHANKAVSYNQEDREQLVENICHSLPDTLPTNKIFLWT